ncbi:conserved hypothetical protein [Uncinocarpus reesii 1704]|uniref:Uncharacterized protein n=1 Tax=Uncinocarpus reesii (strain UAMH 1704) TaxID=336963 RepID=C4JY98_UNCRE|nr:uncharacterized protein UREG_07149 [Uncinocarpus reesii 1704]EEP82284.1 conserved hypothetical protein [Uncinocarpus reesii 1704]
MPLLTLHLLSLQPGTDVKLFVKNVRSSPDVEVVVASRPRRLVIRPEVIDIHALTSGKWDLLLLLRSPGNGIPPALRSAISDEYSVHTGVPSKLLKAYPEADAKLKREASSARLTGALEKARNKPSSQSLELSADLLAFMDELVREHDKPVTMLNLLHFHPNGKPEYYKYGQGFASVAGKRGGNAKIVGNVVKPPSGQIDSRGDADKSENEWWNEISIVHYPSIRHFCDMLAGEDYQEINSKYRLGALRDTMLLCTTEFDVEETPPNSKL